jgi:AhpD family alkylhydroperoxidase
MERISPVNPQTAQGRAKELLDAVKAKLGIVPNMTRAMAVSPPVLDAYLGFNGALSHGVLPARLREQLALDVGEENHCDYCVSAHSVIGKGAGLTDQDVLDSRRGTSADPEDRRAAPLRPDGGGEEGSGRGCRPRGRAGRRLR